MRPLIVLFFVAGCAHASPQHVPAETAESPRGRALFYVMGDQVFPLVCYSESLAQLGRCGEIVGSGDRIEILLQDGSRHGVTLGARVLEQTCDACYSERGFDVEPETMPTGAPLYGVSPVGVELDVRLVGRGVNALHVATPYGAQMLTELARSFFARMPASDQPPFDPSAPIPIAQRADVDINGDGVEDHLYVVDHFGRCARCFVPSWSALAVELSGDEPRMIVLREGEGASFRVEATLELDGRPPREIVFSTGVEGGDRNENDGPFGSVGRLEGDRLVEIGPALVDCPVR